MFKLVFAAAAVSALTVSGAAAGGHSKAGTMVEPVVDSRPAPAPVASPRFSWEGAYAGASLGYGRMSISGAQSGSSAVAALFAGYRWDAGQAVYGIEGQISPAIGSPTLPGGDRLRLGAGLMLTAGVPVDADRQTLVYGGIGPTMLRSSGAGGSKTATGASVQLGVDHMLSDEIMLRGTVNYTGVNSVSNANLKTRSIGAGVGLAFRF